MQRGDTSATSRTRSRRGRARVGAVHHRPDGAGGRPLLSGVDLTVATGEFVALVGAVTFSYCMGNISNLILQVPSKDDAMRDKIAEERQSGALSHEEIAAHQLLHLCAGNQRQCHSWLYVGIPLKGAMTKLACCIDVRMHWTNPTLKSMSVSFLG